MAFFYFARAPVWSPVTPEDLRKPVDIPQPPSSDTKEVIPPSPPNSPPPPPPAHDPIPEPAPDKPAWTPDFKTSPEKTEGSQEKPAVSQGEADIPVDVPSKPQVPPSDKTVPEPHSQPKEGGQPFAEEDDFSSEFGAQGQGRLEVTLPDTGLPAVHWRKLPENFPLLTGNIIPLPTGRPKKLPKLQAQFKDESSDEKFERLQRLSTIKRAFEHAWNGYKTHAMGHDELYPIKGGARDPFNGWGATLVDSLDTLWIMDMKTEFTAALDAVKKIDFTTSPRKDIPVFETVIRYLGGLLGAYDISGHRYQVLLDKAVEIGEIIIGAFDTPNRMPVPFYHWSPTYVSQAHRSDVRIVLAELGSLSLELTRLAQLTNQNKYYDAIARVTNELEILQNKTKLPGMWPLRIDASGCVKNKPVTDYELTDDDDSADSGMTLIQPKDVPTDVEGHKTFTERKDDSGLLADDASPIKNVEPRTPKNCMEGLNTPLDTPDTFSMGALADSTYEYLPKEYMLLGGLNEQYRTMYEKAMDTARKYLLFRPMVKDDRDLRFTADLTLTKPIDEEDPKSLSYSYEGAHLTCFVGGMFAVGAKVFGIDSDLDTAAKLTNGCVWAYESTRTGIMPEKIQLLPCENNETCPWDEALYRKALDPNPELRAGWLQEQRRESTVRVQEPPAANRSFVPTPSPSFLPLIHKRDTDSSSAAVKAESTPAPLPKNVDDLSDRNVATTPNQAPVISHEDFIKARIENERLSPGFVRIIARQYVLRPEAIESVFIMFRLTGDNYWRQKGWKMFEAVEKYTRTELAHSAIQDVTVEKPAFKDEMESFWLAETLKYFYLLFSDPTVVSLDEYVLNTEAHPLKRPEY